MRHIAAFLVYCLDDGNVVTGQQSLHFLMGISVKFWHCSTIFIIVDPLVEVEVKEGQLKS